MLKEVAEKFDEQAVAIHVVWMPMVPGDSEHVARSTGAMYASHDVHQYYDAERVVGLAYHHEVFGDCVREAVAATPRDHPLHETLREWASSNRQDRPLWDAVLFYPPGVEWMQHVPEPMRWSKQVGFMGKNAGRITGMFFRNDCRQPPVDSDWNDELRAAMKAMRAD